MKRGQWEECVSVCVPEWERDTGVKELLGFETLKTDLSFTFSLFGVQFTIKF